MTRFSQKTKKLILGNYVTELDRATRILKVPRHQVELSIVELRRALDEAEIDVGALLKRRSSTKGVSPGKIAGVVAYRLARFKIVHMQNGGMENNAISVLQELAALLLVSRLILQKLPPPRTVIELAYQMARRHSNQETLGVVFDII